MSLTTGDRLGPYEIVARIGAGGMGEVFRARDPRLGREVAVKVIAPGIAAEPHALPRFERESRAIARLSHPNILAIYDVGQQDGVTYAVMELLQGESLRHRLLAGPVPVRKALEIATQIARGLAAAHDVGIVHRDLKPENVFLTTDGQVKILDFGLARTPPSAQGSGAETALAVEVTEAGTRLGTPGYMAPEQVQGETCDHRADIFAFGAVLYELVTGQRAFRGTSSIDVMHAVVRLEPDVDTLAAVPGPIRRLVLRCLEKRPEDRFSSARDVAFALESASDSEGAMWRSPTSAPPRERRRLVWWASAAAVVAIGAVVVWAMAGKIPWTATKGGGASWRYLLDTPGVLDFWTFSPDGRSLAALVEERSSPQGTEDLGPVALAVWVREGTDLKWRKLAPSNDPSGEYLRSVAWAPDGRSLAYYVVSRGDPELRLVDVASGAVRHLATLAAPPVGMAWSAESGILIGGAALRLVTADTGAVTDVLPPDPAITWRRWPSFLPDGRSFVFTQNGRDEPQRGIFLGRVGSSTSSRLVPTVSNSVVTRLGDLLFGYQGSVMGARLDVAGRRILGEPQALATRLPTFLGFTWFAISPDDTMLTPPPDSAGVPMQLTVFDRDGQQRHTIGEADAYLQIELSPDSRQLAVEKPFSLGLIDIARGTLTPVTTPPQLTGSPSQKWSAEVPTGFADPVWSPDGRTLAAGTVVEERFGDLALVDLGSGQVRTLLTGPGWWPEAWSGDGKEILVSRTVDATTSIWAVPMADPSKARALTPAGRASVADDPQLSPDGRWLSYTSNETGTWEVYVQEFNRPGPRRRISPGGGIQTRWSDDGTELFYLRLDGMLMSVALNRSGEPGAQTPLFKLHSAPDPIRNEFVVLPGSKQFIGLVPTSEHSGPPALSAVTNATAILRK